ncbi:MAG: PQQ-dependent sugar dehydrogenase [Bacteroidales bacterium]
MDDRKNLSHFNFLTVLLIVLFTVTSACETEDNGDEGPFNETLSLQEIATGITSPVSLKESPDETGRLFVVDQTGLVFIVRDGVMLETPFLDITDKLAGLNQGYDERGLLDIAFHPGFGINDRFFVYYSAPLRPEAPADFDHTSVIAEYAVSALDPDVADPATERIILQVDQPQGNHNGGALAFGPDNYLYISLGDGGNRDDEGTGHVSDWYGDNAGGNGQDITQNLMGSILRIDIDVMPGYGIPEDNPFVGTEGLDEQYAYGFRNPYRMSFDMGGDRALYVSDAGQELYEEVSRVTSGNNYGWNVREGAHCFDAENPETVPMDCPTTDDLGNELIDPVLEFNNSKNGGPGLVVVGGYVYRGSAIENFQGHYVFGSWSDSFGSPGGVLFHAGTDQNAEMWEFSELPLTRGDLGEYLLAFGQDNEGEIYVLTTTTAGPSGSNGTVYKLVPGS